MKAKTPPQPAPRPPALDDKRNANWAPPDHGPVCRCPVCAE